MKTKCCVKCGEEKTIDSQFFQPRNDSKDGFRNVCRECLRKHSREYNRQYTKVIATPQTKRCSKCGIEKCCDLFHKNPRRKDGLSVYCGNCMNQLKKTEIWREREKKRSKERSKTQKNKEYRKNYFKKNQEKIQEQKKMCYLLKKDQYLENARKAHKRRMDNNDVLYKIRKNLRRRINLIVKNKTISTSETIGCNWETLKIHLEQKFLDGMSWENYGTHGWHIDHIIPLVSAQNEIELYKLNHYTNLQPLWAKDNLSKGGKLLTN